MTTTDLQNYLFFHHHHISYLSELRPINWESLFSLCQSSLQTKNAYFGRGCIPCSNMPNLRGFCVIRVPPLELRSIYTNSYMINCCSAFQKQLHEVPLAPCTWLSCCQQESIPCSHASKIHILVSRPHNRICIISSMLAYLACALQISVRVL